MKKRYLNIALAALLACSIIFLGNPLSASAGVEEPQKVREVTELRTECAKTFELSNGQYMCEVHTLPIHYKDSLNQFRDINNSIKDADKAGYRYSNTANAWRTYFADNVAQKNAVVLEKDGYSISFNLADANVQSQVQTSAAMDKSTSLVDESLATDSRITVYKNIYKDVDIAYTSMNSGLKESIILRSKDVPTTFTFDIELKGLGLIQEDGNVYFANSSGEKIFTLNPLFMEDANEKNSYKVEYKVDKLENGYRMTIIADTYFLNSADTVFPVILDPSFTVYGSADTYDTYVCTAHPDYNYNYGSPDPISTAYTKLRTGKDDPYGVRRIFIRFRKQTLPDWPDITSAYIKLYKLDSAGAINIRAYSPESSWDSGDITWSNKPGISPDYPSAIASYLGSNWYRLDVTHWTECYYSTNPDYGFCIKDNNESDTNVWATFASSDYSGSSYDPVLQVTYNVVTYPENTVSVYARCDETFADEYQQNYLMATYTKLDLAEYPFQHRWNIVLDEYLCLLDTSLPGDDCPTGRWNPCDISDSRCGYTTCRNEIPNPPITCHHKNGYRIYDMTNDGLPANVDLQILFLSHSSCYMSSGGHIPDVIRGLTTRGTAYTMVVDKLSDDFLNIRRIQHEVSHAFGCQDNGKDGHYCTPGQRCIMHSGFDTIATYDLPSIWCSECCSGTLHFDRDAH